MGVELQVGKKRRVTPHMNVTPLVDVVLVLLIIFMVITPMMVKQFWVHVPPEPEEDEPPVEIRIIEGTPVPAAIGDRLCAGEWARRHRER